MDMTLMGERSIQIDCDVIQADGGTRTASITGAYVALADAVTTLMNRKLITKNPLREFVAAVSVGMVGGIPLLDLDYSEDSGAEVDMNFVMTSSNRFVEIQGTAESEPFSIQEMDAMRSLAIAGIARLFEIQKKAFSV
jgi:ribonuclease PH